MNFKIFQKFKIRIGTIFTKYSERYPSRYAVIYGVYAFLNTDLYNPVKVSTYLFALVMLLITYLVWGWEDKDIINYIPVTFYLLGIITASLFGYLIRFRLQNTGVFSTFQFSGTRLFRKTMDEGFDLNVNGIDSTLYQFVNEDNIDVAADLNVRAYKGGTWEDNFEVKKERNLSHVKRNSHSIMLFKFKHNGPFVGFTHIFPVTQEVWYKYTRSKSIKDNTYKDAWIVGNIPETKDEFPFGLILFSVGCPELDMDVYTAAREGEYSKYLGEVIEKAQVYHINELLKKHFTIDERYRLKIVPALLQNEDPHYINYYKGFSDMSRKSGDDSTIIEFRIRNTHVK